MKRGAYSIPTLWYVLCAFFLGFSSLNQGSANVGVLTGANLNFPFVRRSIVTQWFHGGIDYRAENFTPIVAAKQGTVSHIENNCPDPTQGVPNPCAGQGYGNTVFVNHGGGYETRYGHLAHSGFIAYEGQTVAHGQQMALTDNSGNSQAPHLHFELWVNGASTDPYAGATHWAGADPFPMGYRNQSHAIVGPFQLSNTKIRDRWAIKAAEFGSPLENPWSYDPCTLRGTLQTGWQQRFERGRVWYCGSDPAQADPYPPTFLPRVLADRASTGWNSTIYIRNLSSSLANVSISFYKTNGKILDSRTYINLPGNGIWEISAASVVFDSLVWDDSLPNTFSGAAIVASDQGDVAVTVRTDRGNSVTAYTGVSSLNNGSGWGQPGTTAYVPFASWDWESTPWKTTLYIQNTTPSPAYLTFYYCPQMASCEQKSSYVLLSPYNTMIHSANEKGSGFGGAIRVVSTQPIAVVDTQESGTDTDFWGTSDYNAFAAGATTVYLPSLMVDWYNARSSFTVQNLGASATGLDIYYVRDYDGQTTYRHFPKPGDPKLPAGTSRVITQWDPDYGVPGPYPPGGWHGSARVVSTDGQLLAISVNQQFSDQHLHQAYSGSLVGNATLYAPFAVHAYATGGQTYSSATDAQNLATTPKDITSAYFYGSGTQASGGHQEPDIGWLRVVDFYVPSDPIHCGEPGYPLCPPAGQRLSARITIETGGTMCGIHNIARASGENDYGASYNMVQR